MSKKVIVRALAALLAVMMSAVSLSCCGKKLETEDNGSFSMGDFTISGSGDESGVGDSRSEESKDGTSSGDKQSPTSSAASGSGKSTGKKTSLTAKQVLEKMPKMKNKELKICLWEELKNTVYGNAVESFETKTGIKIKTQLITKNSYDSEVATLIASGDSPDMVLCIYNTLGMVKNLQPITKSGYDFNDTAWDTSVMDNFTYNGNTYAMQVKNSPQQNVFILVYNKKTIKKAEMEDPHTLWKNGKWTWDKLWKMCESFLAKNKNKEGYYGINFGLEDAYLRCFDAGLYGFNSKTGKFESYIKNAETVNRYTILKEKIDKHIVAPVSDTDSLVMGYTLLAGSYSSAVEKRNSAFSQLSGNLGTVPFPTDCKTAPGFEFCAWGIPIGSKNAAAVPYFVRYVFGPDLYNMNDFYNDAEAKETVEDMLNRGKICYNSGWTYSIWSSLMNGTASQVKSVLDSFAGSIEDTVAVANEDIKSLNK